MKYIEYEALKNKLQKDGSSINEFVEEVTGEPLNELYEAKDKEDTIETGRAGKGFHSPKFVMKRKKLNSLAKQFLKEGKTKVIEKYAPKILKSTSDLITKASALSQEGKSPDEINQLLAKEAKKGMAIQDKSMGRLDQVIDKLGTGYDKRVKELISGEKSGLKEKSQRQLDMYWAMLELQVRQALDKALVKHREKMIEKAVGDNEEMAKMLNLMNQSENWKQRQQEYTDQIAKQKKEYEAAQKGEEGEEGEEKPKEFKVGEQYQYSTEDGKTFAIKVIKVTDDGIVVQNTKNKNTEWGMKKDGEGIKRVGKKIKDAPEEGAEETSDKEGEEEKKPEEAEA